MKARAEAEKEQASEMKHHGVRKWPDGGRDVVEGVALPLKNLEFMIDQYLMANGCRLDVETRYLLAGVRDCVGRVASSSTLLAANGK